MTGSPFPSISISDAVRQHISTHFDKISPGSKFYFDSPEAVLQQAMKSFPVKFTDAVAGSDGRFRISLDFLFPIGTCNIVALSDLTPEQQAGIKIVDRQGRKVRAVKDVPCAPTSECQLVFSPEWNLITMFPGMMAPPLPASPDVPDEFWDNHVFIANE